MASKFAVIKTGGKQYKVSEGDKLYIEKLAADEGADVTFDQVLLVGNGKADSAKIGTPLVDGASVSAKVLKQGKAKKKIILKYKNKTRQEKKKGHRQPFSQVEIKKIAA